MPIDRRTFVLGSGVAVAGIEKKGEVTSTATMTAGPSFELRIVGWDRSDGPAPPAAGWIAIDPHWRGAWH